MNAPLNQQTIEQYCETLYTSPDPTARIQAESILNYSCPTFNSLPGTEATDAHSPDINSPIGSALFCRNVLENSRNPYALMFATSRIKTLIEGHFATFSTAEQHGLRSFVLQYIFQNPDLLSFILAAQAQLFGIITKLGWVANQEFRLLLDHINVFFQHGVGHRILGAQILTSVATEMNTPGSISQVRQRKSAVGFRDTQLLPIFQAALSMLRTVLQSRLSDRDTEKLKEAILLLMKACLSFDFIGTSNEEASDDIGSIQVPATWRVVFEQPEYLNLLWECWTVFSSPVSVLTMECLSQAASIRRSVFSSEEARHTYIDHIMRESVSTLTGAVGQIKLQDVGNYHEFCRMLSRFKNTFQLSEVCDCKDSESWLTAIGEFTVQGFHLWKAVTSLTSAKQETELLIEAITVSLSRAYVKSRLDCVHAVIDGEADDPLESEETLLISLEMFANIARTKYKESGRIIVNEFQGLSLKYRELIQRASAMSGTTSPPAGSSDIKESLIVIEMQLTWMVYIMAACIGGRIFRSSYIGDDSAKAVKVYTQLAARWGLNTPNQVLDVILNSSLGNLRSSGEPAWRKQEDQLILRTLKLFTNLSSGYSSVRYIRKLDTIKALLRNHNSSEFRFLDPTRKSTETDIGRCRTIYYTMLSRILFAEDNIDAEFWRFVKPWEVSFDRIALAFEGKSEQREEDIRLILLGLFKDLRGFVTSINNRRQFNLFYEWFYPAYTPIVTRAIEIWPQNELAIPILRFWQEFATNKSSRVTFDSSSPNGILLFRETSNILSTYGQNLLNRSVSSESARWGEKYKGIMLYFNIMSVSLSGKYANFGVFKLYNDKALDRVLEIFFQLMLSVPVDDMISFPKLASSYFSIIDVFAVDHMMGLPMMPQPVLAYIFRSLGEVILLPSTEVSCASMACAAIDKMCTFVLNWLIKNKIRKDGDGDSDSDEMVDTAPTNDDFKAILARGLQNNADLTSAGGKRRLQDPQQTHWLVEYVLSNKGVLNYLLMVLFQVITFENRSNQWSLARAMLGLILLNGESFQEYTARFVRAQLPDRQEQLQKAVDMLMQDVENNLTAANRDKFTTNASAFRRECSLMTLMTFNPDDAGTFF
ncbi:hypothetical protein BGZ99_010024 [Dissophora globulifera]|uniref:Exportin-7/Ran-binding protein 17 TPR repeats domain-containing protein n=1 Tax=Dissophora globulifera TaxID=979702 RepID=A0A9P6RY86_9FUNG|nr:hypothetical protein BGZ99_010024 [Dissophora globulifera]